MKESEKSDCDDVKANPNYNKIVNELTKQSQQSNDSKRYLLPLPEYKCIKHVKACQIKQIIFDGSGEDRESDGSAIIIPESSILSPIAVDRHYMTKHKPQVGGYYVVYKDGYESYSPADAFEEGYRLIDEQKELEEKLNHFINSQSS